VLAGVALAEAALAGAALPGAAVAGAALPGAALAGAALYEEAAVEVGVEEAAEVGVEDVESGINAHRRCGAVLIQTEVEESEREPTRQKMRVGRLTLAAAWAGGGSAGAISGRVGQG
jgi:hypothetical protein